MSLLMYVVSNIALTKFITIDGYDMEPNRYQFVKLTMTILVAYGIILE